MRAVGIGRFLNLPDQDTESLFIGHMHQQWANQKCETLTVANLGVVEAEALENSPKHPLAITFWVSEHVNTWKASPEVLGNDPLIRAGFARQPLKHFLQSRIPGTRHTLPNHTPKWRRDTLSDFVR